jgi:hypothetical protein
MFGQGYRGSARSKVARGRASEKESNRREDGIASGHYTDASIRYLGARAMVRFRCIPMDTTGAVRFRQTGRDDAGNPVHTKIVDRSSPCRHCLAEAKVGEKVLLGSYHFGRPHGVYWTPSPIFVHADGCERFEQADVVPEIVRNRLVSVRAYDADDMCIYELGDVCDGTEVERLLDRALVDRRTDYVNIHTARPGCFLCRVARL